MSSRVSRIEFKRSIALWAGVIVLATALAFLYLLNSAWSRGTTAWTAQWTSMAMWTRSLLFYLWPVALGLGALQGLRDHRSRISELLTSTPRPAWHRAATVAGPTAITLLAAFALLVLVGAAQVIANTEYPHLGWLPISLVGALFLIAGAVLGMGIGRALPSVLTPPVVAMAGITFTSLMQLSLGQTHTITASGIPISEPNRLSLLSPALRDVRDAFTTVSTSVHLGQVIWLLGMVATGFALLVVVTSRAKLIALTPVVAGVLLSMAVLPTEPQRMYVLDEAATEPVCDGPVCVTRTHQARLADFAVHGEEALGLLAGALGDQAPVSIRENTVPTPDGSIPRWTADTVLFGFDDDHIVAAQSGEELTRALIAKAMVPGCSPVFSSGGGFNLDEAAAQSIATGWVLGDLTATSGTADVANERILEQALPVWEELNALPPSEQLARINAMRAVATSCDGDALSVLAGGASR
ncbi:hypothetical protein [Actinoalloteichus hymeniacidonis]|uniref:Uncharacterized protein n=1 Tax=Actinoalloteichus hymeniacidonis TaxID=340345 RepID=A0AAC9HU62_9PSEU|nr:hypothetical protein [Actinoalloteichus hymeniacidonis]AOS65644.1 hypothetical protein TL08_24330 [Actinoalloteichus hymeniacidonis]MBB5906266.1 hypothetical protein [Actinoalloteichus hymeniacidonis]